MDLGNVAVFVKVVQTGSFSKAAQLLGMPNTTVSARIARLEARLGVTLIQRTTRKLHVTPAGQTYFAKCVRGLAEIEAAEVEVSSGADEPRGLLRITVAGDVARSLLPAIVSRYVQTHPHASVEVMVANELINLVGEGIDLAIRPGKLKDSALVARKWKSYTGGLWASRDYLSRHVTPSAPLDLLQHQHVILSRVARHVLPLSDGRETVHVVLNGRIIVDDMETLLAFVLKGDGIGGLPDFVVSHHGAEAALVRVLPQWTWASGALTFLYPAQPFVPAKVRAFIDVALAS